MPRIPGFKSETQRDRFKEAGRLYERSGPLARLCGAKLRTGAACSQLALEGEARCLRHGGPDAARRHRERQLKGLEGGSVSPEEFARAEARRARNKLVEGWKRNPSLPGRTIDLGPDHRRFVDAASALGVDVDGLLPAVGDWLAWRFQRTQMDRTDDEAWVRAVRQGLRQKADAAEQAMVWVRLGDLDKRTKIGKAVLAALRAGGEAYARAKALALAEEAQAKGLAQHPEKPAQRVSAVTGLVAPATPLSAKAAAQAAALGRGRGKDYLPAVLAWAPPQSATGAPRKRAMPDRVKAWPKGVRPTAGVPSGGRRKAAADGEELAALMGLLWQASPPVRAMFDACPDDAARSGFLRALAAVQSCPDDPAARHRWVDWVRRLGD